MQAWSDTKGILTNTNIVMGLPQWALVHILVCVVTVMSLMALSFCFWKGRPDEEHPVQTKPRLSLSRSTGLLDLSQIKEPEQKEARV